MSERCGYTVIDKHGEEQPCDRPATGWQDRFWSRVAGSTGECWEWRGYVHPSGYGQFWLNGRNQYAHRVAYEALIIPIPRGLQLDHLCRNRACVNPGHLEPVTSRVNTLRGDSYAARAARKSRCKRGHKFTPENTYVRPDGARRCRVCHRERQAAYLVRAERDALRAALDVALGRTVDR